MTTTFDSQRYCEWCGHGIIHSGICPRVKAIEYDQHGRIVRVEFRDDEPEYITP